MTRRRFAVVTLCLLATVAAAAEVTTRLDRETIMLNETFTLIIDAPGQGHAEPDLSPLEKDFHVLGTSRGTRVMLRDGRTDARTEWQVNLMAKRSGELTIPGFDVANGRSQPVPVRVLEEAPLSTRGIAGPDVYLETEVSPQSPVVQGQVTYIVRLLSSVDIREGALSEPEIADATVERLGRDVRYEARRDGRRYQVTERRFAIFPQRSGQLVIPPTVFDGRIPESRNALSNDFLGNRRGVFGTDPFGSIFRPTRTIRRMSDAVTIQVRPRPGPDTGHPWLPAESLAIKERWASEPLQFRVGEPGTRTITLIARGLTATQLPELPEPSLEGFKVYPDKPALNTVTQGTHVVGTREQKFAIVPAAAGVHLLPEVRIPWWNTKTERWEEAVLPAREITALPAAGTTAVERAPARPAPTGMSAAEPSADAPGTHLGSVWVWSTMALLVAWLGTVALWWRAHTARTRRAAHSAPVKPAARASNARRRLDSACAANDPRAARDALLAWAAERWSAPHGGTLVSVAMRVADADARSAIQQLDRCLYVAGDTGWDGASFLRRVAPALVADEEPASTPGGALPELYPTR